MEAFTFNTIELILLSAAGILFIIQLIYYFGLYNRIHRHNTAVRKEEVHFSREFPPLSVIICARNEADNLRKILPTILEQDYPQFEVIVINDASTDETADVLGIFEEKYSNLYHSFTPESARYISHKKLALTLGIKASKHDWLVFTETNCIPASNQWLKLMARNFTSQTQIVLGYSGYDRTKGWFHKRVAFDALFQSMRYLGFAIAGKPYMGIGRNLAYRKELFFKQKGYSSYLNLQRGEDDLFINQIATAENTKVETDYNATVRIQPIERIKDWKEEKVSFMATARYYRGIQRYLLGFETFSRLLFYGVCIAGIVFGILNFHWLVVGIALFVWILRYILQAIVINQTAKEMGGGRKYYFSLPIFDLLQPIQSLRFKSCRFFRGKGDFMRR
ncbi:Glycosyltransferase, catalytic subunit of cellulose synthase and poly-beta-1,6-N-acetylglucosamine synthase [Bacteroides faecichinchillae]|uniref:Glycosyltransferase, catalytic subunit of cellulose synthase and poly-beta-1,6-N-acetylglucosamine synthase n=1 Tax=Bacteroides faecichinchillae TaxID=871325 RepID=A0A1M4XYX8_9BACE|nr:glycosyltransferase [Bacteroides faecichinchillae]THG69172.1 glycosyltransferase [Bacteroides faecichinchillae]SHE98650.1 Glycosyltransferase, catalytic subunit of cellulose synthase and poly-beta-1,6-N-acetylglucosamine synthase [Bacteroides faecichinchillae]